MATEDDVRRLALALPGVTERPSYGTPGFRVRDRLFARIHQGDGALVLWTADPADKESYIASEPDVFFTTPHYDGHAHVLVRLDRIDAPRLAELLRLAWEVRAPPALRAEFGE